MIPLGRTIASLACAVVAVTVSPTATAFVNAPTQLHRPTTCSSSTTSATSRGPSSDACSRPSSVRRHSQLRVAATPTESSVTSYTLDGKDLRGPVTPVDDTVMVKVDAKKEMTDGGLFMPQTTTEKPTRGTVVAAGEGKRHWDTGVRIPMAVEVGDRVVFGNYDGTSVQYQGTEHLLMRDTELLMAHKGEEIDLETVKMVADRVLLKVKKTQRGATTSAAGVLIAESATRSNRPSVGVVVKVGPGRMAPSGKVMPMYVKPGDKVKFKDFASEVVTIKGTQTEEDELVVIRNVDVLAKW